MTKEEFTQELGNKLVGIPQNDIDERVSYYIEMIDDRMEEGIPEDEAVAAIGTVDSIVEHIMSEIPLHKIVREKAKPARNKLGAGWIVLIILGFPVWFPLIVAAFAVVLSLYITLWAVMISFYATVFALFVAAIVMLPLAAMFIAAGNPAGCGFSIGAGLICAGLGILFTLACAVMTKGIIKLTGAAITGIKRSFVGKEGASHA